MYSSGLKDTRGSYLQDRSMSVYQSQALAQNNYSLENRVAQLTSENERLIQESRDKSNQIQAWRDRYQALEKSSNIAVQEYAERLEHQKRLEMEDAISKSNNRFSMDLSTVENQNRNLQGKLAEYESRIMALNSEIQKLSQINIEKTKENDQWKVRYSNLEKDARNHSEDLRASLHARTRDELEMINREYSSKLLDERRINETEMKNVKQMLNDLESKLRHAASESDRYNMAMAEKIREVDALKSTFANFERQKNEEMKNLIARLEREKNEWMEREGQSNHIKFNEERSRHESKMREISNLILGFENQMSNLSLEIERLQGVLRDKIRDEENLKQEYLRMEEAKNAEIQDLKEHFESLRKSALREIDIDSRYQAERAALEAEIVQNRQKISEMEVVIKELIQENERAKVAQSDFEKALENIKMENRRRDTAAGGDLEAVRAENERLKSGYLETNELRAKFNSEKQNYENQVVQLMQNIMVNKAEIDKLYNLIDVRRQENELLNRQLNQERDEVSRLEGVCKEFEGRFVVQRNKYDQLEKETVQIQRARDTLKSQLERGNIEVAQKNRELLEKIKEVDALKLKYENSISNLRLNGKSNF